MRRLRSFYLIVPLLCLFFITNVRGDVGSSIRGGGGGASITANNIWTGTNNFANKTNISGPGTNTNVEIGSINANANATAALQVIIGNGANSGNNSAIAIGTTATTTGNPAIAIGAGASAAVNQIVIGSNVTAAATKDVFFGWNVTTAATASTTPVNINGIGGTGADNAGGDLFLAPGKGTGASAGGKAGISRNLTLASSSTVQSQAPAYVACPTKILSNTSATATTIATITTTSTTGGSVKMFFTTVANNGTLQDTDAGEIVIGWNNNAGTVAVAASAVYGQMDSDASGTLATTPTVTAATNVVSIKFTPTWVTIVPTTVTGFATFEVNGVNTIACQ